MEVPAGPPVSYANEFPYISALVQSDAEADEAIATFLEGYYGKEAAPLIDEYMRGLEAAQAAQHEEDPALDAEFGASASWELASRSPPLRFLRVRKTGPDASGDTHASRGGSTVHWIHRPLQVTCYVAFGARGR